MDAFIYSTFSSNVMQFQICMIALQIKGHISFHAAFREREREAELCFGGREGGVSDPQFAWMDGHGSTETFFKLSSLKEMCSLQILTVSNCRWSLRS